MLKVIYTSSTSACFEWQNKDIYNTSEYEVILCGKEVFKGNTNVFSLFDLAPDTAYKIKIMPQNIEVDFKTPSESCCVNVRDFGAVGDGNVEDTWALQAAIYTVKPGGRVFVPAGIYLTGPLQLKSDITFELSKDAVILGHTDSSKYPIFPGSVNDVITGDSVEIASWEGCSVPARQSLICGHHVKNVNIVGQGTIDGNAQNSNWWIDVKNQKIGRPRLVFLNSCESITMHGITGQNSASWQLHPYFSHNISFLDVKINAPKDSPNTDGCDPESCDLVNIIGCVFSVGDDCIAIKSGKIDMGKKYKTAATRHTIRNCLMQFGHGSIVLGSEMSGGVKDLTVNRCKFVKTDRGLRIKTRRGRGEDARIDGIVFEDILMEEVLTPLVMNMYYFCDPDGKTEYVWSREQLPVDEGTPYLGNFTFRNMQCNDCEVMAGYFDGLPEQPINSVEIQNVNFTFKQNAKPGLPAMRSFMEEYCKGGLYFDNVKNVNLKNITFDGIATEEIIAKNVGKITKE